MSTLTDQQQKAVTTIDRHVLVSAGAGSGKTHVLVERYIQVLREIPNCSAANIIAVTFTRKAATEMRTRLKSRIKELIKEETGAEKEKWLSCYHEIDGARIGTIHSLCETILKSFPVEAGIDPQIEILEELRKAELLQSSIDQSFRDCISENAPCHALLLKHHIDEIRGWIASVLNSSTQFREALTSFNVEDETEWFHSARQFILRTQQSAIAELIGRADWRKALAVLEQNPWKDPNNTLEKIRLDTVQLAHALSPMNHDDAVSPPDPRWGALCQIGMISPGNNGGTSEEAKALRESMRLMKGLAQECCSQIPADLSACDREAFLEMQWFVDLAKRSLHLYTKEKQDLLVLDFNDLIELAVRALAAPGSAARSYYNETTHAVLVDEFQDTNRLQSNLIRLLAGHQTKLFLIGDDKQSIYKFQGADVSTFNEWKQQFEKGEEAAILQLTRSFRSHPSVVRFINSVFSTLMDESNSERAFKARFEELTAAREDNTDAHRVEVLLFDGMDDSGRTTAASTKINEGVAVANWIMEMIMLEVPIAEKGGAARPVRFGDFAVLVQRNRDFSHLEAALAEAGIPYVTLGGKGFLERQEIDDIANLFSFLAHPRDDHSLIGVLRSPIFAVTDDIIHSIGESNSRSPGRSLWQSMRDAVNQRKPGYEMIAPAVKLLGTWFSDSNRLPVSDLLRKVILSTHYDLLLMSLPNGHQRSRNIWKLVWLAAQNEELSCGQFAESIKLMRQYNVKHSDAPLDTGNAVKLMTIHASKGLEFPVVALPVLGASFKGRKSKLIFHRDFGVALNSARDDDEKSAWYTLARSVDDEMELAEKKRLLYVAMTRARDYLGLFVVRKGRNSESFRTWLSRLLELDEREDAECWEGAVSDRRHASEFKGRVIGVPVLDSRRAAGSDPLAVMAADGLQLDLLDPIPPQTTFIAADLKRQVRITPVGAETKLEPTIVGTFFHSLMEHVSSDVVKPSRELIQSIAFAQGESVAHPAVLRQLTEEGERLLDLFLNSELAAVLKAARRRFHEIPYVIFSSEKFETRRPDLLFEDAYGGWQLVDFKTDHFALSEIEHQASSHRNQLKQYAADLESIAGIRARASIYFAQHGVLHTF
jgi:ATP-dependent helicase/nuclease subunit A